MLVAGKAAIAAVIAYVLVLSAAATASADQIPEPVVRAVMDQAEILLGEAGVNVSGYAHTSAPRVDMVAASHVLLLGNDGAFLPGRIYLNRDGIDDCQHLNLLHEVVHDATVKYHLFRTVSNMEVRAMMEALADQITEMAAQKPYRPGCVTQRHFDISRAELVSLATR